MKIQNLTIDSNTSNTQLTGADSYNITTVVTSKTITLSSIDSYNGVLMSVDSDCLYRIEVTFTPDSGEIYYPDMTGNGTVTGSSIATSTPYTATTWIYTSGHNATTFYVPLISIIRKPETERTTARFFLRAPTTSNTFHYESTGMKGQVTCSIEKISLNIYTVTAPSVSLDAEGLLFSNNTIKKGAYKYPFFENLTLDGSCNVVAKVLNGASVKATDSAIYTETTIKNGSLSSIFDVDKKTLATYNHTFTAGTSGSTSMTSIYTGCYALARKAMIGLVPADRMMFFPTGNSSGLYLFNTYTGEGWESYISSNTKSTYSGATTYYDDIVVSTIFPCDIATASIPGATSIIVTNPNTVSVSCAITWTISGNSQGIANTYSLEPNQKVTISAPTTETINVTTSFWEGGKNYISSANHTWSDPLKGINACKLSIANTATATQAYRTINVTNPNNIAVTVNVTVSGIAGFTGYSTTVAAETTDSYTLYNTDSTININASFTYLGEIFTSTPLTNQIWVNPVTKGCTINITSANVITVTNPNSVEVSCTTIVDDTTFGYTGVYNYTDTISAGGSKIYSPGTDSNIKVTSTVQFAGATYTTTASNSYIPPTTKLTVTKSGTNLIFKNPNVHAVTFSGVVNAVQDWSGTTINHVISNTAIAAGGSTTKTSICGVVNTTGSVSFTYGGTTYTTNIYF